MFCDILLVWISNSVISISSEMGVEINKYITNKTKPFGWIAMTNVRATLGRISIFG